MKDIISNNVKIIRIPLDQMCYIVPIIVLLNRDFNIELYYITDGRYEYNESCLRDLLKYGLDKIIRITLKDYVSMLIRDSEDESIIYFGMPYSMKGTYKFQKNITFYCSHGIDEEAYILHKRRLEGIIDTVILTSTRYISTDIIKKEYDLDPNKKTILFQDTTNTFFHILDRKDLVLLSYQNRLIDDLIKLKKDYNVIIRFHPQYYHGVLLGEESVCERVRKEFTISYTQMSLIDLYDISDIIISTRYTSSGYQSLFMENKNIIMIDLDLSARKKGYLHRCSFVEQITNQDLINHMDNENIIGHQHVFTEFEDKINILSFIEKINNEDHSDKMNKRRQFIKKVYNLDPDHYQHDDNNIYLLYMYLLCQTSVGRKMFSVFDEFMKDKINEMKYSLFVDHLKKRLKI